jgi:hypothetical protein
VTTQGSGLLRKFRLVVLVTVLAVFGLSLVWTYLESSNQVPSYPYSSLLADSRAGRIASISQDGLALRVWLVNADNPREVFVASDSINVYAEVCAATGRQPGPDCGIRYEVVGASQTGQWIGLLITSLLPVLLISGLIYFMVRAQQQKK